MLDLTLSRAKDLIVYLWNLRFLSLRTRWPIIKFRRRLLNPRTGLGLRDAYRHARSLKHPPEPHPFLFVLRLLWPFPRWRYSAELPKQTPRTIMANPDRITCQTRDLIYLRSMPVWRSRDTPQRAFYRLYEAFCTADGPMITYETEYFWRQSSPQWATINIQDPQCGDPEQYAVMAALAEQLVDCFAWRLKLGLRRDDRPFTDRTDNPPAVPPEQCPAWTANVPASPEKLVLHQGEDQYFDSPFHRRNIFAATGHFYTV